MSSIDIAIASTSLAIGLTLWGAVIRVLATGRWLW